MKKVIGDSWCENLCWALGTVMESFQVRKVLTRVSYEGWRFWSPFLDVLVDIGFLNGLVVLIGIFIAFFRVSIVICSSSPWKSIGSFEVLGWYMNELEWECKDSSNPSVDNSIRLKVRVIQHLFDVLGVDFNNKILFYFILLSFYQPGGRAYDGRMMVIWQSIHAGPSLGT